MAASRPCTWSWTRPRRCWKNPTPSKGPSPAPSSAARRWGRLRRSCTQSGWAEQAHAVGDASLKAELDRILSQDLVRLLGLGLLVATLGLWASTRSLRRALFVSLTCGACAATGLGMMQRLGAPFTATSLVLPLLVLVVTVADALHVLARWDWERGRTDDARLAWRNTLRKTYAPCLVASLTTAAGCFSFAITPLLALRDFAWDASLAILVAYPLLLAPLWAAMLGWPALLGGPLPKAGEKAGEKASQKPAALLQPQRWTPRLRLRRWLALWGGVTLLFAAALPFARSESDFLQVFFAPQSDTRQGFDLVDGHLGGSGVLDIIIDSGQEEHFRGLQGRDAVLAFEGRVREGLGHLDWLRDVNSYLTPLRVAHRGLEGEGPRAQDDATLAQELFFLDLSQSESDRGVLQPWLTFDGASARVRLITPNLNSQQLQQLEARVRQAAAPMQEQGQSAAITGPANYVRYLSSLVFESQGKAGALAIALIGVLVLLQLGLRWGAIALAVNLPPLLITLGTIVWLGLPFDFGTILVTSLTLGLVVDSSLHLFSCARRMSATAPLEAAFGEALRETLPPILRATAVITAGAGGAMDLRAGADPALCRPVHPGGLAGLPERRDPAPLPVAARPTLGRIGALLPRSRTASATMDTPADHPGLDEYLKGVLRARVYDVARVTELDPAPNLSRRLDNRVLLKREDTQSIFSFKCRGAANWMARNLPQGNGKAGGGARVVAASAGNHAQGVAIASQRRGMRATLVMPQTTPDLKTRAVAALGAEVVLVGDTFDEAKEHAETLAQDEDVHLIPPFDDPAVICGQGTVAMEVLRQWQEPLHALLVPLGGGGLLAGILAYVKSVRPEIRVIGVEPANAACGLAAMEAGRIVELDEVGLFADGVAVRAIGQHCWPLIRDHCDQIVTVDTDEICAAVRDLFEDLRVIAEPAGALATAGLRKYIEQTGVRGTRPSSPSSRAPTPTSPAWGTSSSAPSWARAPRCCWRCRSPSGPAASASSAPPWATTRSPSSTTATTIRAAPGCWPGCASRGPRAPIWCSGWRARATRCWT